jgi:1-aminocyclopropane-1-carboxylate deaminase/D-cysteine desulfhydrase-like pyridoxal-dependent ACC family enzyme
MLLEREVTTIRCEFLSNNTSNKFKKSFRKIFKIIMDITDLEQLTPIEEVNGILFKREDLFRPFIHSKINGGKVRQCLKLMDSNRKMIESRFNSKVGTATSVKSPQGLLVAECAQQYGFSSIVGFASSNTSESLRRNKLLRLTGEISDIRNISGTGVGPAINKRLKDLQIQENFFLVDFGISSKEVLQPIIAQCENLPDELDYLVVPSGSCITLAGIAEGVRYHKKKVGSLVGVQIAGYDRNKKIKSFTNAPYVLEIDKTFPYEKTLKNYKFGSVELDAVYEAKAFEWLINNIDYKEKLTLFWIIANFNSYRFSN